MVKSLLSPKVRIIVFLTLLNAAWILCAWLWLDRIQWLWLAPIALSINVLLLTYDQFLVFSHLKSRELIGNDPYGLLKTVHRLAEQEKLPTPHVHVIDHSAAQIFCYAKTKKHTRLFITDGLIRVLSQSELEAVLIYQMVSMQKSYNVLNYWVGALVDVMWRGGRGLEKVFAFVFGWTPPLANWLVSPWIGILQLSLFSGKDFQLLDNQTATRMGRPDELAQALWKMEAYARTQPWANSWVFSHMCMVSPLNPNPLLRWITAQPSLKRRIKKLIGRYPL